MVEDDKLYKVWKKIIDGTGKIELVEQAGNTIFCFNNGTIANYGTFVNLLQVCCGTGLLESRRENISPRESLLLHFLDDILNEILDYINISGQRKDSRYWTVRHLQYEREKKRIRNTGGREGRAISPKLPNIEYEGEFTRFAVIDTDGLNREVIENLATTREVPIETLARRYWTQPYTLKEQIIKLRRKNSEYTEGMILVCPNFEAYEFVSINYNKWIGLAANSPKDVSSGIKCSFIFEAFGVGSDFRRVIESHYRKMLDDGVISKDLSPEFFYDVSSGIYSTSIECRDWGEQKLLLLKKSRSSMISFAVYHHKDFPKIGLVKSTPASNRKLLRTIIG